MSDQRAAENTLIGAGFGKMEPWNLEAKMETMLEVQH